MSDYAADAQRVGRLMGYLVTLFLLVGGYLLLVWVFQRALIYFPSDEVPSPSEMGLSDAETVTFQTEDGLTLAGWFVPRQAAATADTVVVFNGNTGSRAGRAPLAAALRDHGYQVLLFDYRGFGGNPGTPSEAGLLADARAARRFVLDRPGVAASRLIYFGESLGSGVAVALAAEHEPAALILRSPFTSLVDVGRAHYPWLPVGWLLQDRFASHDRIGGIECPVLVIAGDRDRVVPVAQSHRLFDAVHSPKDLVIVAGADHNHREFAGGPTMIAAVTRFLSSRPHP